jgi:hypothetical protein
MLVLVLGTDGIVHVILGCRGKDFFDTDTDIDVIMSMARLSSHLEATRMKLRRCGQVPTSFVNRHHAATIDYQLRRRADMR